MYQWRRRTRTCLPSPDSGSVTDLPLASLNRASRFPLRVNSSAPSGIGFLSNRGNTLAMTSSIPVVYEQDVAEPCCRGGLDARCRAEVAGTGLDFWIGDSR